MPGLTQKIRQSNLDFFGPNGKAGAVARSSLAPADFHDQIDCTSAGWLLSGFIPLMKENEVTDELRKSEAGRLVIRKQTGNSKQFRQAAACTVNMMRKNEEI